MKKSVALRLKPTSFPSLDNCLNSVKKTVYKCTYHTKWIKGCPEYGSEVWEKMKHEPMICAGTVFGTASGLLKLLDVFVPTLQRTYCNDQGVLNALVYTRAITATKWPHEQRIVLSMNVAKTFDLGAASVVHTGDNPKAISAVRKAVEQHR